jgi:uncharacterized protein YbjQ (UPF0145 family)
VPAPQPALCESELVSDSDDAPWDGRGLPRAALRRLERAKDSGVATSLLSAPAATGLAGVGFEPIGEVMGSIAQQIAYSGWGCGWYGGGVNRTVTSLENSRWAGVAPLAHAVTEGWETAIARLEAEAVALGADGVVGVRLRETRMDSSIHEYVAMGTAVRSRAREHSDKPFITELGGQDVAKLLHAGWVPVGIALGVVAAVRHDDYGTASQAMSWSNTEVYGYTELVTTARSAARTRFRNRAHAIGGDDATITAMTLRVWGSDVNGHTDHYALATVRGTTVLRFAHPSAEPTQSLTMLPLSGGRMTSTNSTSSNSARNSPRRTR